MSPRYKRVDFALSEHEVEALLAVLEEAHAVAVAADADVWATVERVVEAGVDVERVGLVLGLTRATMYRRLARLRVQGGDAA